ncbi:MAG: hypothetical protein H6898_07550 [Rhodobacter sp.]|nr:hypothetical protein [Paracoccaceae bacterium]MCC0076428.1 hypothetical protein [Rhodobacter sp.]
MPFRISPRSLALAALTAALASPALAQIELTPLTIEARSYDAVDSWQERPYRPAGVVEVVHMPGNILLDVRAVFDGPWSDTVERLSVSARDIALILPDGTEMPVIGGYPNWGQLALQGRSMSGRRPRDFPTSDSDLYWNGLFVVPKGVSQATLRIGGDDAHYEGPVTIPAPSTPQDAAAFASFQITGTRRFRTAELTDGRNESRVDSTITAPAGQVLAEVRIEVTGVATNQTDGSDRFTWNTHNYRLVDGHGATMGLVGERFMNRLLDSQYNGVNIGDDTERTVLWLVPEGLAEARLLYGETEVARVPLASAAITDTD